MKRRIRKVVNFFAFNLLFFALYLNFIHKDKLSSAAADQPAAIQQHTAAFSGTVLVENPAEYEKKNVVTVSNVQQPVSPKERNDPGPLKLSIN